MSQPKSKPMMNLDCEDAIGRVVFNFIKPGEDDGTELSRSLEDLLLQVMIDQGNLMKLVTSMIIQNWIMTVLGLLKSGKVELRHTIDQGNLIKRLGICGATILPFIMETPLLDGNAQPVRYGGMLHDRSGQLDGTELPRRGRIGNLRHGK